MDQQLLETILIKDDDGAADGKGGLRPPPAFRSQQKFWNEVRDRILERNPAVRDLLERLY